MTKHVLLIADLVQVLVPIEAGAKKGVQITPTDEMAQGQGILVRTIEGIDQTPEAHHAKTGTDLETDLGIIDLGIGLGITDQETQVATGTIKDPTSATGQKEDGGHLTTSVTDQLTETGHAPKMVTGSRLSVRSVNNVATFGTLVTINNKYTMWSKGTNRRTHTQNQRQDQMAQMVQQDQLQAGDQGQ